MENNKPLTSKQLAELIFPAFAASNEATILSSDKRTIFYSEENTVYAWIPIDIIKFISSYLKTCDGLNEETLNTINLIIDTDEYFKNPENWMKKFSEELSKEFDSIALPKETDFKDGYITIKYEKEDLLPLKKYGQKVYEQLIAMCQWITGEKRCQIVMRSYNPTPVKVEKYLYKKIQHK